MTPCAALNASKGANGFIKNEKKSRQGVKRNKKKPSTRAPTNLRTATVVALQLEGPLRHQAKRTDRIRLKT